MPRRPRSISASGFYHIVSRGAGKQVIFEDELDYIFFLQSLKEVANDEGSSVLAWCLMSNHVHLLIQSDESPGSMMKRLNIKYAAHYNRKYERVGHLFQDRFRSESVESERYLMIVIRYIHQNPVRAGLVKSCEDYSWSSYMEYISSPDLCNVEYGLGVFGTIDNFIEFHKGQEESKETPIDATSCRLTDSQAIAIAEQQIGEEMLPRIAEMPRKERDAILRSLKDLGIGKQQLQRLTGVAYGVISRA